MDIQKYLPNRVRCQFSGNSTAWQLIGTDGTGYATYAALLAANATPFPGPVTDFPTGIPAMLARSKAAAGGDGSTFDILTNSTYTPVGEDDTVSGSGQTLVYTDDCIKLVWIKKSVGGDIVVLTGMF